MLEAPLDKVHAQAFNVGSTKNNYQIRQMADFVMETIPNCTVEYTYEHATDSRSYNVSFEKLNQTFPDFNVKWDVPNGVEELYECFQKYKLKENQFQGGEFIRLSYLESLREQRKLNESLKWNPANNNVYGDRAK